MRVRRWVRVDLQRVEPTGQVSVVNPHRQRLTQLKVVYRFAPYLHVQIEGIGIYNLDDRRLHRDVVADIDLDEVDRAVERRLQRAYAPLASTPGRVAFFSGRGVPMR